jgi:hypothetical protein
MLVYIDPERLDELRGPPGAPWTIRRGELLDHDLLRRPGWTLYIATTREASVRVIAYLEELAADSDEPGRATACDADITPILDRLGCAGGVREFPAWATGFRVLTPSDADLLRHRLGLPLSAAPPLPSPPPPEPSGRTIEFVNDAVALELLAAAYEDLASDSIRMVLADRLLELGYPRGEMMALQLSRARTGAPPTPRERKLFANHGGAWTEPVSDLLASYEFRRGFLATATLKEDVATWPRWYEHPIWTTVEEVECGHPTFLLAPGLRSLRRVAISYGVLALLARQDRPLAIEAIVGRTARVGNRLVQGGVRVRANDDPGRIGETTVLDRLRSMCLSIEGAHAVEQARIFLMTPLGKRLEHIELFLPELAQADPEPWRRMSEHDRSLTLGLRGVIDGWLAVVVRRSGSLIMQLGELSRTRRRGRHRGLPDIRPLLPMLARFGQGLASIQLERVGEVVPGIDLRSVVDELRGVFPAVELGWAHRWRSP